MTPKAPPLTFATGNAQKLLALPSYALGVIATLVVPRVPGRWVVGCGSGIGEGALALYRHVEAEMQKTAPQQPEPQPQPQAATQAATQRGRQDHDAHARGRGHSRGKAGSPVQLVWLARDTAEATTAESFGIPAVVKSTFRGFWLTLRADVVIVTHGLGDANRYATRGAFLVQLWHGIPVKRIHLDSSQTTSNHLLPNARWMRRLLERLYRLAASTISLIPAASELSASRLRTAFGLPADRVVVTGDPRDDVLCQGTETSRTASARAVLLAAVNLPRSSHRVILYAPTWRDGEVDPGVPSDEEWVLIAQWLVSSDSLLIIRPHPHGVGSYVAGIDTSERIHLLDSSLQSDINPILAAVDLLITDYSSIALDFALLGRPIAFLAADLGPYSASRGLYEEYDLFSGGHHVTSWTALVSLLGGGDNGRTDAGVGVGDLAAHSDALALRYHAFRDGRNTERVYAELCRRLEER